MKRFCMVVVFLVAAFGLSFDPKAEETGAPDAAREKVRKWVQTRELISRESTDWEAGKAMLENLIVLREREAKEMDEVISQAQARVENIEKESNALEKEERERRVWREQLEKRVKTIEDSLIAQTPYLPDPVVNKVPDALIRLKDREDGADLQSRFRDVLAILNECLSFDSRIHNVAELREFDGREVEVEVLYLGMSQAWYVDRQGKRAGTGIPTNEGWKWTDEPSIAPRVLRAIAIANKKETPDFVRLPVSNGETN